MSNTDPLAIVHSALRLSIFFAAQWEKVSEVQNDAQLNHTPSWALVLMQAGDRALCIADLLLRADCRCCVKERRQLAARCY